MPTTWVVGGGPAYTALIGLASDGEIRIQLSPTAALTDFGNPAGPQLTDETVAGIRITFESDGATLVVNGITDATEPYFFTPSNASEVITFVQ